MRPVYTFIFILLLLAVASITVAVNIDTRMHRYDGDRWETAVEYLNECSAAAHVQSIRYESYAERADTDKARGTARLFRALAHSERVHERICAHASRMFNGEYTPPTVMVKVNTPTRANIEKSLAYERRRLDVSAGLAAKRAIDAGNRYIARLMIWIDGSNRRHIEFLEKLSDSNSDDDIKYGVCPNCGNMYEDRNCDIYCPFCQTHSSEFAVFGD